jgi:hypothetical protein
MKWGVIGAVGITAVLLVLNAIHVIDLATFVDSILHPSADKAGFVILEAVVIFLICVGVVTIIMVLIDLYNWITGRK